MGESTSRAPLAWRLRIDRGGCHQLWLGPQLSIGSSAASVPPDLPIRGPLSRRHLTLHRAAEGWWAEAHAPVTSQGRSLPQRFDLGVGSALTLAEVGVQVRRPTALSASAIITVDPPHRHAAGFDSVVLLHDVCLLGPEDNRHIVCPWWSGQLVLHRREDELHIRGGADLLLDGEPAPRGGHLVQPTTVQGGSGLRMHLEPC